MKPQHSHKPIVSLFLVFLLAQMALAQEKMSLENTDYALWSTLSLIAVSDNAQWVAYTSHYPDGNDTLTVRHCDKEPHYSFPKGFSAAFGANRYAAILNSSRQLIVQELSGGYPMVYEQVSAWSCSEDGDFLFIVQQDSGGASALQILMTDSGKKYVFPFVGSYNYNSSAQAVAITVNAPEGNSVQLLALSNKHPVQKVTIAASPDAGYSSLTWNSSGTALAFEIEGKPQGGGSAKVALGLYDLHQQKSHIFNTTDYANFPQDISISCTSFMPLSISDDGQRVFFGIQSENIQEDDPLQVQLWNAEDKFIYPSKNEIKGWQAAVKPAVWWPKEARFFSPSHDYPNAMLTGDQKGLVTYDLMQYEPQYNYNGPVDVTLTVLGTGKKRRVVEKLPYSPGHLFTSPAGRFILYARDGDWWAFDVAAGSSRNLTAQLGSPFFNSESDRPSEPAAYGCGGWDKADRTIFLYDRHDIWQIALDGSFSHRLTRGKEKGSEFRFAAENNLQKRSTNLDGMASARIDTETPQLILEAASDYNACYMWYGTGPLKLLVKEAGRMSQFIMDKRRKQLVYVFQDYQTPPMIQYKNLSGHGSTIFESNRQHKKFYWGKATRIAYQNGSGNPLQGILYYPANYDASKTYPMIVHVYEKQSKSYFNYINPSLYNDTGFNVSNLASQGYFVLLPDITYKIGNPGQSALDCTLAAVGKALEIAPIDPARIGLIGHSWGGYETDYILTKTPVFAAAVAGAAITDLTANYFSIAWNNYRPNYYQSEFDQVRMGTGYFNAPGLYLENSPLYNATGITTPLLSWAGEDDRQVSTSQTIALHMALRRLNKKNIMLLYPKERHVLLQPLHQQDLTLRTEAWFGYFLKGTAMPSWISPDILK